jgi:putative transcriptional regulator
MSEIGKSILKGAKEALQYARGRTIGRTHKVKVPKQVDVRSIRDRLHMTRIEFAGH